MRKFFRLIAGLIALAAVAPAMAQTAYPAINDAVAVVSLELRVDAGCRKGGAPKVGIRPLDSDDLPISEANAKALYEAVFAGLNATKPDCVTFVDGAGASGVIRQFLMVGTGAAARQRVDEAFRGVDYVFELDVFDRGGTIQADLKLSVYNGETIAAPDAFDVPENFIGSTCAAGAVPLERGVRTAARKLTEAAPDLTAFVDRGGRFADTDEAPSFTSYFGRLMRDALTEQTTDIVSGRSVRLAVEGEIGQPGVYAYSFRYWPCDDAAAAAISAELRDASGKTVAWRGKVRLDTVPDYIDIFPPAPPPAPPAGFWSMSFAPRTAHVDDVVSIVADVATGCIPFFLDLTEAGEGQVVPADVFQIEPRGDGGLHYRVDTSTPYGLKITEADAKGEHYVGYICTPSGEFPDSALLEEIHAGFKGGSLRQTDPGAGTVFWFERYVIR